MKRHTLTKNGAQCPFRQNTSSRDPKVGNIAFLFFRASFEPLSVTSYDKVKSARLKVTLFILKWCNPFKKNYNFNIFIFLKANVRVFQSVIEAKEIENIHLSWISPSLCLQC